MANSSLKYYYFDGRGRAEAARLILAAAGKKYEDIRFKFEEWPKYKPRMPFGQIPVLEVDGKMHGQSVAINTFLAREFGFYSDNNLDALKIDQVVQLIEDLAKNAIPAFQMPAGADKDKTFVKIRQQDSPKVLGHLERLLKESGTEYFVGNKMTLADIAVFDMCTGFLEQFIELNDNYPLLQNHKQKIQAHNKIGPYVTNRPESAF